ncbi:MAG: winged helix-turn-helix domain-containing protein [Methanotrichaceae archaeon]|nr:winged helix-turn-helix domain-containing protein [Methanotrichaceae archaeon]
MACDTYDLAEDRIKAFSRSSVRAKIMLCLMDGPKTAAEMEKSIGTRVSTILHAVKEMSGEDLILKAGRGYTLTNIGLIQALALEELTDTIVALDQHKEFWLTHDISGIPFRLQKKIGMLARSETIEADHGALLKTVQHFINELNRSQMISGVSPIIIPGYAEVIGAAVDRGANVRLVVAESILEIMCSEYSSVLKGLLQRDNFELYLVNNDIKVAFTVTESFLNLGLFRIDGGYDLGTDLICVGDSATAWGNELFEYYRGISRQVNDVAI